MEHLTTEEIFLLAVDRVEDKPVKDMTEEEFDEVMERNYRKLLEGNCKTNEHDKIIEDSLEEMSQ